MKSLIFFTFFLFLGSTEVCSQLYETKFKLSKELNEISGLEMLNDSILIAINDGGNKPYIYFINLQGDIIKKTNVSSALNHDWEDLALDDQGNLYIADVGNNLNQRRDLNVLKVNVLDAFEHDTIVADKIEFAYKYQKEFTQSSRLMVYDSEALYFLNDTLRLLTKIKSKPAKMELYNGTFEYSLPTAIGNYEIVPSANYETGGDNRLKNQVTGADIYDDILYILTYGKLITYKFVNGTMVFQDSKRFKRLTQKEAIVRYSKNEFYVAAEKHPLLGGPFLYKIEIK